MIVDGKEVMAAVHVDRESSEATIDVIASVYERNTNNLFTSLLDESKMLYVDEKRIPAWMRPRLAQSKRGAEYRNPDKSRIHTKDDVVNWEKENKPTISMALDLDGGVGAMQLAAGVSAKEEAFQRMLRSIERGARQWRAPFKGSHDSRERARGSTIGLAVSVYRALPSVYRVKLEPMLRKAAVLERMIATGKLTSYGQVGKDELAELRAMVDSRTPATL